MPNLLILGAPKSGTSSLHAALALVEGVFMSPVKEPAFFIHDEFYRRGLEWYSRSYFAGGSLSSLRGESTPWYMYSNQALSRIRSDLPGLSDVVVLVRNPVDRAWSMYQDQAGIGRESRSFEESVTEEIALLNQGGSYPRLEQRYVECGLYARFLDNIREQLPRVKLHVLPAVGSIDNESLWRRLEESLSVPLGGEKLSGLSPAIRNASGRLAFAPAFVRLSDWSSRHPRARRALGALAPGGMDQRTMQTVRRVMTRRDSAPASLMVEGVRKSLTQYFFETVTQIRDEYGISL